MPENQLLGNMYYGAELSAGAFPLQIPAANASGHYAGDRIWRNTGISTSGTTTIGSNLVGWEWDAIPTQAQYLAKQPAGVKPLTNSSIPLGQNVDWLQDEGRVYAKTNPPGQCACAQAVKYTAASGALVFASGTNDWANALAPNPDTRIIQATYNIFSDMGAQPVTPVDVTLDPPSGPQPPTASFTISPNPAQTGQTVTFDGSSSTDLDGPITKYEWDLDGNGTYEVDGGTSPGTTHSYSSTGVYTVRLRVTDAQGVRSTTNRALSIDNSGTGSYPSRVLGTTGLLSYWRMGDTSGTTLIDSFGNSNATTVGAPTLGAPGVLSGDSDTAVGFNGTSDAAQANLALSGTSKVTVEFWMKWNGFTDDDDLAFEFTPNFNSSSGGFLVDPNAPQAGGKFGVAIGNGSSRNNAFFNRPSAGQWHYYAFVLDSSAAAADQVTPYVDGQAVAFTKGRIPAPAPATSPTPPWTSCRAPPARLFGNGSLDDVALYDRALDAATVGAHLQRPPAADRLLPELLRGRQLGPDGQTRRLRRRPRRTAPSPSTSGTSTATAAMRPTPAPRRRRSAPTPAPATVTVGLRVTDSANQGDDLDHDRRRGVGPGSYSSRVLATAGLAHYWRLGDTAGTSLTDSIGNAPATAHRRRDLRRPRAQSPGTRTPRSASTAPTTPPSPRSTSPPPPR